MTTLTQAHVDALMDIAGWEHEHELVPVVEQIVAECVAAALCGDQGHRRPEGRQNPERPGDGDSEPLTALPGATDKALRDVEQRIAQYAKHYPTDIWPDFGPDDDVRKDRAAAYMARHLLGRVIPAIFSDYRQEQGR